MILCMIALPPGATFGAQRPSTFTSFDYPGATSTSASGINADGAVVGAYVDSASKQHGFLLSGGNFTSIDYAGAIATDARGINDQGDIVGTHVDAAGMPGGGLHGYLLQQGAFTAVDYPGHLNTIAQRITASGQILGCYHDTDTMGTMHGVLMSGGNFTSLSAEASMNNGATPDGGVTAGLWTDMMTGVTHGYLASNDAVAPFDFPFSISTSVWDMNASGEVVGAYTDASKKARGFVLSLPDTIATLGIKSISGPYDFVSIDYPGAAVTQPRGINRQGDVAGFWADSAGKVHGFLLSRAPRRE